mgnify:CR=1 FL=1
MSIGFIPVIYYTSLYYYILLFVVLATFFHTQILNISNRGNLNFIKTIGVFSLVFVVFYMGLRPISELFGDMVNYSNIFEDYKAGNPIESLKDPLFHSFALLSSKVMNITTFFLLCSILYILPLYIVCKKWFKEYWFYGFLFLIISFSFWAYGTNGIRNGIATSLFLLGISRDKRVWQIVWILLAIGFHKSMLLPTIGFVIVNFYNKPKQVIAFWFLCILLSLVGGKQFEILFASLGLEDERIGYLTTEADASKFSSIGFRWDFLFYSGTAVFAGWYYIVKKKFNDKKYFWLYNTYVFANAFWILVIQASFSNRFAYLSWFMMALIIVYPLLKQKLFKNQHKKIGFILLIYFIFTFFMNVILVS